MEENKGNIFFIILGIALFISGAYKMYSAFNNGVKSTSSEIKSKIENKTEKKEFKVNEPFQNDFEKITMTEVDTNFTGYDEYMEPKDGYKYIMTKFEIENTSDDNSDLYINSSKFNASADGVAVEETYVGRNYESIASTITKGNKKIGYIFYEVPQNSQKIVIDFKPNLVYDDYSIKFIVQE